MHPDLKLLSQTDIYLIDQYFKGRLNPEMKVLDAGAGNGRNLSYFLKEGYDVTAIDQNFYSVDQIKQIYEYFKISNIDDKVFCLDLKHLDYDATFDFIICNAVLHFVETEIDFHLIIDKLWKALKPGGTLFIRLSTQISVENVIKPIGGNRFQLPSGTTWYLPDLNQLLEKTEQLGATLVDPIKTTNVQNMRSMTTWVLSK